MPAINLPAQPTPFLGRADELVEVTNLLSDPACSLLTLTGPGGIGKTRLAIEAARMMVDAASMPPPLRPSPLRWGGDGGGISFPNGIYFVPLQPLTSPDFIIPTIADSLKFSFYGEGDPKEQLLDYLREKHLLLVLDNFDHLVGGADLLPEILETAADVKLLVTSRERLHLREEWVFEVGGLAFPDKGHISAPQDYTAVQLFVQTARRAGYTLQAADSAAIGRICQLVEGIPLAIELSAAWLRTLPCHKIATEIERSLDILTTSTRNVPEQHRSMRAAFEHSWTLLSESEKTVFRKLAVFRGGFTSEAAEQVAEASLFTLSSLVDRSLLRVDATGRYSLQELLRQYADYQLDGSGEAEATDDAHCLYYAEFLDQRVPDLKGPNQIRALDEIEAEIDNVRVSWRRAVTQGKEHEILQSLDGLLRFFEMRSRYQEAVETFSIAAERFGNKDSTLLGQLLMLQAWFLENMGYEARAFENIQRASAMLPQIDAYPAMTMPLRLFNALAAEFGGYEAVLQRHQQHLAAARQRGDGWGTAWAQMSMGELALFAGKLPEAQRFYHESLAGFRALGDRWAAAAWVIAGLRMAADMSGKYQEARQHFLEQLTICKEIGERAGVAWTLQHLGRVSHALGEPEAFQRYLVEALKLSLEIRGTSATAGAIWWIAEHLMAAEGRTEQAVEVIAALHNYRWCPAHYREMSARQLETLKAELPPEVVTAAIQRGEGRDLESIARDLLEQFSAPDQEPVVASDASHLRDQSFTEPLGTREMEILRLIADGLNSREVAQRLVLSVGTIRWYLRNIYGKLDAHSRSEALARARELELLT